MCTFSDSYVHSKGKALSLLLLLLSFLKQKEIKTLNKWFINHTIMQWNANLKTKTLINH